MKVGQVAGIGFGFHPLSTSESILWNRLSLYDQAGRGVRHDSDGAQEQLVQASSRADVKRGDLARAADVHIKNRTAQDGVVGRTGITGGRISQPACRRRGSARSTSPWLESSPNAVMVADPVLTVNMYFWFAVIAIQQGAIWVPVTRVFVIDWAVPSLRIW